MREQEVESAEGAAGHREETERYILLGQRPKIKVCLVRKTAHKTNTAIVPPPLQGRLVHVQRNRESGTEIK